jgi:dipeptidyl aminopeptidase/acylaminoacyl peptidase
MPDGEELLVSAGTFQNFRTFRVSLDDGGSAPAEWLGPNQVAGDVCGSRLVFERRDIQPRDIWQAPGRLADDAGALARPLIESPAADVMPTFSRDGEQIAFRSTITGKNQIWVANRDGTNLHQVTYQEFGARQPTWSPDGEWIAFASEDGGSLNVWVVNLGTRRLEQITNSVADDLPGAFSPDGHHIYVESLRTGEWQIFSVPFPGGELEYEAERVTPDGGAMAIPSPDGHYLYYYKPRTVFRLPLPVGSGAEQAVLPGMNINLVAWDVAKNGIYFRPWGPDAEGVYRVNYLDFESDRTTEVFRTEVRFHGLRVSPDETTLIFDGPWVSPGIELVLIENFR